MTRERADALARDLARRSGGDGDRLLELAADLDPETAAAIRARLAELGAQALAGSPGPAPTA